MIRLTILIGLVTIVSPPVLAKEGFSPSHERNVVELKGPTDGATGFLIQLPKLGLVLMTQVHVVGTIAAKPSITWGVHYGIFFHPVAYDAGSFELPFTPEVIWQDEKMDVAVLKAPPELVDNCHCDGFLADPYSDGPATLIGYPIRGRRTYPLVGKKWTVLGELFGSVEQMQSTGTVWRDGAQVVSDVDAISGDSGGPVLNENGRVIGMIHLLKSWSGMGYRYQSPNIEVTPIDDVLSRIDRLP